MQSERLRGCILAYRFVTPSFLFLDYLATPPGRGGGGVGGALYQRLREIAAGLKIGLFFEVLPADPSLCHLGPEVMAENRKRLAFYARFGAYPIAGTAYETPLSDKDDCSAPSDVRRLRRARYAGPGRSARRGSRHSRTQIRQSLSARIQ